MTARETLLVFTGAAVALLLVAAGTSFYRHDYRDGIWCFLIALALALVFFRKRKLALMTTSLGSILVLLRLGFPLHQHLLGLLLGLGCVVGLYLAVRWSHKRYPYLSFRHLHTFFEGEAAMAAENTRIEAEARELVKKRPHGPWLFR
jgi:uncharacterized membrane protein